MTRRFTNKKKVEYGNLIIRTLVEQNNTVTADEIKRTALHLYNRSREPEKWQEFQNIVRAEKERGKTYYEESESERYQAR